MWWGCHVMIYVGFLVSVIYLPFHKTKVISMIHRCSKGLLLFTCSFNCIHQWMWKRRKHSCQMLWGVWSDKQCRTRNCSYMNFLCLLIFSFSFFLFSSFLLLSPFSLLLFPSTCFILEELGNIFSIKQRNHVPDSENLQIKLPQPDLQFNVFYACLW